MLVSKIVLSLRSRTALNIGRRWMTSGSRSGIDSGLSSSGSSDDSSSDSDDRSKHSEKTEDTRRVILKSALDFVPSYGWSRKALEAGAEKVGYPSTMHGMFSRGGIELVYFFNETSNEALAQKLTEEAELALKEPDRKKGTGATIRDAVEARLRMLIPYVDKWPQAMALMSYPQNAPEALGQLRTMVDDIWYFAGDQSTDLNWYTKRISLALVFNSTELFMIQDSSDNFQKTWKFLDRRLENLTKFGKCIRECQENTTTFANLTYSALHVARNVFSVNSRR